MIQKFLIQNLIRNSKMSCQTHVTREQICTKITIVILLTLRIPDTIQKEVHQQDLFLMTQCGTVVNHLIVQGKFLNMCHNNILQTLFGHVLFVAQHQPKGNTSGSMLGHSIWISMCTCVNLKIVTRGKMAKNLEMMK